MAVDQRSLPASRLIDSRSAFARCSSQQTALTEAHCKLPSPRHHLLLTAIVTDVQYGALEGVASANPPELQNCVLLVGWVGNNSIHASLQRAAAALDRRLDLRLWVGGDTFISVKVLNRNLDGCASLLSLCCQNALTEQMIDSRLGKDDVNERTFDLTNPANVHSDLLFERSNLTVLALASIVTKIPSECESVLAEVDG